MFSFGPKNGDFTKSWNLGNDINGENYFSSPTSSLEERIYAANPKEVESFLLLDNTKILSFGYSDIYSFLEYGATTAPDDDSEAIISDPFSVSKVAGLLGEFDGLANALPLSPWEAEVPTGASALRVAAWNMSCGWTIRKKKRAADLITETINKLEGKLL